MSQLCQFGELKQYSIKGALKRKSLYNQTMRESARRMHGVLYNIIIEV